MKVEYIVGTDLFGRMKCKYAEKGTGQKFSLGKVESKISFGRFA